MSITAVTTIVIKIPQVVNSPKVWHYPKHYSSPAVTEQPNFLLVLNAKSYGPYYVAIKPYKSYYIATGPHRPCCIATEPLSLIGQ